ncbi:MAG: radical SAM protein [Planctomycetes bacterium]|nr:radical SAM protein [Planctomycetota bacterium]
MSGASPAHAMGAQRPWLVWLANLPRRVKLGRRARLFLGATRRRRGWFLENLTARKTANLVCAATACALKRETMSAWPLILKIDISPLCNLRCTICVHAEPHGNPALERQVFRNRQRMTVEQYRRIIDEVKEHTLAVSLYYLGDPLAHPDLDEMCSIARDAGLNVHVNTNFSFALSDERIRRIVTSGLTHLTVCVDGLSQEKYERTRVGGRINQVLSNLRRVCAVRQELRRTYPRVEVQYVKYQHNIDELPEAQRRFRELGVDQVTDFWGALNNYTDRDPANYTVFGPMKSKPIAQCFWPHFAMLIKYNGDVLPCCNHRLGEQYACNGDTRALGNVFETSVREVWNSEAYRAVRRFIADPESVRSDRTLRSNFCYGCRQIFETDELRQTYVGAKKHTYEAMYTLNQEGRPVRNPWTLPEGAIAASCARRTEDAGVTHSAAGGVLQGVRAV